MVNQWSEVALVLASQTQLQLLDLTLCGYRVSYKRNLSKTSVSHLNIHSRLLLSRPRIDADTSNTGLSPVLLQINRVVSAVMSYTISHLDFSVFGSVSCVSTLVSFLSRESNIYQPDALSHVLVSAPSGVDFAFAKNVVVMAQQTRNSLHSCSHFTKAPRNHRSTESISPKQGAICRNHKHLMGTATPVSQKKRRLFLRHVPYLPDLHLKTLLRQLPLCKSRRNSPGHPE
ncbi:hypothetical protein PoB_003287200 [Plakobranchus ocellatus]|uniref:Uncharacterized protein n=1 Tax=Plakobranchus ocellatus TaxID=259542 RepID=A0AAV4AGI7_9GAST|nr:hypothetical protein PoB_003287200 [Plakobranchus ocellatus]